MGLDSFLENDVFGPFVDGAFLTSSQIPGETYTSPTTGKAWKQLRLATDEISEKAIQAAAIALTSWKKTPAPVRGKILRNIGDLMLVERDILANIMAMEMGKPVKEGVKEVDYAAGYFHWFAGEAERIYGLTIPSQFSDKELMILYEPVGVCAAITPWNFPLAMASRKIAAGLAAGCTFICKPSRESPLSLLALAEICRQARLPKGILNVLIGPEKDIGLVLLKSKEVRKLSFTGSCAIGKYLYQNSADTMKKLTLELGGHAPVLIFDDADLDLAVEGLLGAKFRNNGQTCVAANRVYIQKTIFKPFIDKLISRIQKLRIGDPLSPDTDISTVLHPASKHKVEEHVQDALSKGANCLLKGESAHEPIVLSQITDQMLILKEETFGPVIPLIDFESVEEGIDKANQSPYGLASYVFTRSLQRAFRAMRTMEYGIIGINDGLPSTPQASFGGIKQSGFGREGGPTGIKEYLNEKYVSLKFQESL